MVGSRRLGIRIEGIFALNPLLVGVADFNPHASLVVNLACLLL